MFDELKEDSSIEEEKDVLGGAGLLETNVYPMNIEVAYAEKSKTGSMGFHISFKGQNGESLRQSIYMTGGDAKGNKNYYEKDGKKHYLPGFNQANAICLLSIGKPISDLTTEKKTLMIYDYEEKKELPVEKDVLVDLNGAEITLGVQKIITDNSDKGDDGKYVPNGTSRLANEIGKVFRTKDNLTVPEVKAEAASAEFYKKWLEKNEGKTIDKTKGKIGLVAKGDAATGDTSGNTKKLF